MTFKSEISSSTASAAAENASEQAQLGAWLGTLTQVPLAPHTLAAGPQTAPLPHGVVRHYRVERAGSAAGEPATYLALAAGPALAALEQGSRVLAEAGLGVPPVIAADAASGFALSYDPGALSYLHQLTLDSAHQLYMDALGALVQLQTHSQPDVLPEWTRGQMQAELGLFTEFFLAQHLKVTPTAQQMTQLNKVFDAILANVCAQQPVFIHRNFQSRNLIVAPGTPGVLDCSGAAFGPITYDVAALLRDAAIAWDEEMVLDWVVRYWQAAKQAGLPVDPDIDAFYRDFEMTGVQRHLMQLGLFARLAHEHGDTSHLAEIEQLLEYVRKAGNRYTVLKPLVRLLDEWEQKQPQVGYTF